jgi:hypothetical protein
MMDVLFPLGSLPVETGGRNRLWRHMIIEAIRNDPEWKNGDYQQQPHLYSRLRPIVEIMMGTLPTSTRRTPPGRRLTPGTKKLRRSIISTATRITVCTSWKPPVTTIRHPDSRRFKRDW